MKQQFILAHDEARRRAVDAVRQAPPMFTVKVAPPARTLDQNAVQWPILEAFSKQLQWPVNGQMVSLTPEEWKDVLTAAYQREAVRMALALDGKGMVMLGMRTSRMSKRQFSEYIDFLHAAAAERGIELEQACSST